MALADRPSPPGADRRHLQHLPQDVTVSIDSPHPIGMICPRTTVAESVGQLSKLLKQKHFHAAVALAAPFSH